MNNFNELENIWKKQDVLGSSNPELANYEIFKKKLELTKTSRKDFIIMIASIPVIFILFFYTKTLSSAIGAILLIFSAALHCYSRIKQFFLLRKIAFTEPPAEFLGKFIKLNNFLRLIYERGLWVYLLIFLPGVFLVLTPALNLLSFQKQIIWLCIFIITTVYVILQRLNKMKIERMAIEKIILIYKHRKELLEEKVE